MTDLPDALALFHARFRLRFDDDLTIRYDGPSVVGLYMIDVCAGNDMLVVIEYDPRRDQSFGWNDAKNHDLSFQGGSHRLTAEIGELLEWIAEIHTPNPA